MIKVLLEEPRKSDLHEPGIIINISVSRYRVNPVFLEVWKPSVTLFGAKAAEISPSYWPVLVDEIIRASGVRYVYKR